MIVLKSSLVAERSTKGKGVVNKEDALAFLTSKTALGFSLPPPPFRLFAVLAFALTLGVASAGPAGNHRNEICEQSANPTMHKAPRLLVQGWSPPVLLPGPLSCPLRHRRPQAEGRVAAYSHLTQTDVCHNISKKTIAPNGMHPKMQARSSLPIRAFASGRLSKAKGTTFALSSSFLSWVSCKRS